MSPLQYYGYQSHNETVIYTADKDHLKLRGVIIKVLMNNFVHSFPNFEAFKKVGLKFTKLNRSDIPIKPNTLCDLIEEVLNKDHGNVTFGNYMYMFTEGVDYVVIFRLNHQIYGSQFSFLQEGFNCDQDYIFIIERSAIEQKV